MLAADTNFHDEFHRTFPHFPGVRDWFTGDEHARAETARFNAALQVGYFILGVRAAGLAARLAYEICKLGEIVHAICSRCCGAYSTSLL